MYRFSVKQYHRMIANGVLREDDRVELLDGWIVSKMTHNPPHDTAVDLAQTEIALVLPQRWRVRVQSAITLATSEPEPDVAVVRGPARRYARVHPRPKDIALLVEVADTSLLEDRLIKGRLYARARIPFYWIINLIESIVEVYAEPKGGKSPTYAKRRDFGSKDSVPVVIEEREIAEIAVRTLLP
jgi:Uma2 family endonuclease